MYKLAVFDIDGTLIDTERTGVESLMVTIRELLGKEVPYEVAYKTCGIPPQVVMKWTGHSDYQAMKPYIAIAEKTKADAMKLFDEELKK